MQHGKFLRSWVFQVAFFLRLRALPLCQAVCLFQHFGEAVRPGRRAGLAEIGGHGLADEKAGGQGFPVGGRPVGEGFGRAGGQLGVGGQELRQGMFGGAAEFEQLAVFVEYGEPAVVEALPVGGEQLVP